MRVSQGGSGGILSRVEALPLWSGELVADLGITKYCTLVMNILYNRFSYILFCIPKYLSFL